MKELKLRIYKEIELSIFKRNCLQDVEEFYIYKVSWISSNSWNLFTFTWDLIFEENKVARGEFWEYGGCRTWEISCLAKNYCTSHSHWWNLCVMVRQPYCTHIQTLLWTTEYEQEFYKLVCMPVRVQNKSVQNGFTLHASVQLPFQ